MTASKRWPEFLRSSDDPEPELPIEQSDDALDLDTLTLGDLHMPGPGQSGDFEDEHEEAGDEGGKLRRYLRPIALTVAILLCAATVIFYGYRWFFGGPVDTDLPLVQAIDDPVKVKPESPGGLVVPYKEQMVLNQGTAGAGGEPAVERLLPPPEAPKWPPVEPESLSPVDPESGAAIAGLVESEPPATATTESGPGASGQEAAVPTEDTPDTEAETPPVSPTAKPAATKEPARPAAQESETAALTAAPAASGGYTIQLISLTSADAAESAWKSMREEHPDLLGQLSLTVEKANVSGKTYYRVQAGAFDDRGKARELCARLKAEKQDCLVVRR